MDDYKKLGQSTIFKVAFYIPILLGILLLLVTAFNNPNSSLCFSSECLNNFFTLYKYPISVMGLSIPLSAIAAAIHRSEETSRQISLTQSQFNETLTQNKFSNYIKHKEDFFELIENMENVCKCKFDDPLGIYQKIFPKNSYSNLDFQSHSRMDFHGSNKLLDKLDQGLHLIGMIIFEPDASEDQYIEFIVEMHDLIQQLELRRDPDVEHGQSTSKITWPDNYADTSYKNIKYIFDGFVSFSSYTSNDPIKFRELFDLRRARASFATYDNNVKGLNQFISEIDVDVAFA